ncbi:MBL fold metallo-hydrolase [Methanosarcina sp. UBA5]|uniref:MBL fold metallo-hydrolase n=1 Tax=Methanosarcina sp. UBA5 TaxID=1915593 RepID=UPI0025CB83F9|nr:MBL fold metallo-hydrolase [Methanosarcina sp. UBA5]
MKAYLNRLEAIILSHEHPDHFFGLERLIKFITGEGKKKIPLFLHPEAFVIPIKSENTVEYAKKFAGTDKVYAVLGGFHLTGRIFDPIIQPTIDEMRRIKPLIYRTMHCIGWKAINRFAEAMPEQLLLNTVGTTYVFDRE